MYTTLVLGVITCVTLLASLGSAFGRRGEIHPDLARLQRSALRRVIAVVALAGLTLIGLLALDQALGWKGRVIAVAPTLSLAVALLAYAISPPTTVPVAAGHARSATLTPRTTASVLPTRSVNAALAATTLVTVLVVALGATSSPDESGRFRSVTLTFADGSNSAGPYPGWWYGLPLLAAIAVLAAVANLALRRIAAVPALPNGADDLDRLWRHQTADRLLLIVTAALTAQAGVLALGGSAALGNARDNLRGMAMESSRGWQAWDVLLTVLGPTLVLVALGLTVAAMRPLRFRHLRPAP